MQSSPGLMISLLFFGLFALFLPDFMGYTLHYVNANQAAEEIIDSGQKYGVIDTQSAEQILSNRNLPNDFWEVSFTTNEVDYNEPTEVNISGTYQIKALYILGQAFGDSIPSQLPINIKREALGQVYRR
ncbi:hypothetical protein [Cytobacillus sp. IB215665]|uniref:hypothetical protein n=1 Tax=Cytobacillus sp. IB215665 TaxID=3097357 RepID=UPI002A0DE601|nr:hypothetical protein [Cytobacillus sp. IB215665]MDX8367201.1 hypothetical protein [Cytobacillus sp. IB215665]